MDPLAGTVIAHAIGPGFEVAGETCLLTRTQDGEDCPVWLTPEQVADVEAREGALDRLGLVRVNPTTKRLIGRA